MIEKSEKDKEDNSLELQLIRSPLLGIEIEILKLLNEFGYCEIKQIMNRFGLQKTSAYSHMQTLVKRGLMLNARVLKWQPRAYYLTQKGIGLLKLDLPLVRKIPLSVYEHQLAVIDVYIRLRKIYPETAWVSERRLLREKFQSDIRDDEHLPDGALVFLNDKQCAIEVEKSQKSKRRLEGIMLSYGLQTTYQEVWYFCSKEVLSSVSDFAVDMPYIKVHKLSEYL